MREPRRNTECVAKRQREFVGHANGSKILVCRATARMTRVAHRIGGRHPMARQMMIGNDHINSGCHELLYGPVRTGTAITGDHEGRASGTSGGHPRAAKIVAIGQAIGHEWYDAQCSQPSKHACEQRGRRHAVHIVVAVHEDRLLGPYRLSDSRHGPVAVVKRGRGLHVLETRRRPRHDSRATPAGGRPPRATTGRAGVHSPAQPAAKPPAPSAQGGAATPAWCAAQARRRPRN